MNIVWWLLSKVSHYTINITENEIKYKLFGFVIEFPQDLIIESRYNHSFAYEFCQGTRSCNPVMFELSLDSWNDFILKNIKPSGYFVSGFCNKAVSKNMIKIFTNSLNRVVAHATPHEGKSNLVRTMIELDKVDPIEFVQKVITINVTSSIGVCDVA